MECTTRREYKNFILFLLIAFLLPFLSIFLQSGIENGPICFALYGIQAAAPTISAVSVWYLNKKEKRFFVSVFRKEHLRKAIVLPMFIAGATMLLAKGIFCLLFGIGFSLGNISTLQFIMIVWALFAEEIGWRGYLEPLLRTMGVSKRIAPCAVGVIWFLWHYHYFLQNSLQVPVLLFLISCIVESYIYSFLMRVTNDHILSAMMYHFLWNLWIHIVAINPADNDGNIFPYVFLVVLEGLTLPILTRTQREN